MQGVFAMLIFRIVHVRIIYITWVQDEAKSEC